MILDLRLTWRQYRKADLSSCVPGPHHARDTARPPISEWVHPELGSSLLSQDKASRRSYNGSLINQ